MLSDGKPRLYRCADDWAVADALVVGGQTTQASEAAIFVPIAFGGTTVGALSVQSMQYDAYDHEDLKLLESCALYLGARIHDEEQRAQGASRAHSRRSDGLTNLANRRRFDETLERDWTPLHRSERALDVSCSTSTSSKQFNEAYGHVAGDTCLRQVAQALGLHCARPA